MYVRKLLCGRMCQKSSNTSRAKLTQALQYVYRHTQGTVSFQSFDTARNPRGFFDSAVCAFHLLDLASLSLLLQIPAIGPSMTRATLKIG